MRYLKSDELKSIRIEEDMLKGNLNRMCVCEDKDELYYNYSIAIKRLCKIMSINEGRFKDEKRRLRKKNC